MEEKSNIEIIQDYARSTHRSVETIEVPYNRAPTMNDMVQKYRREVYMPDNESNDIVFVWFSDYYSKVGERQVYCGAFIPISDKITSKVSIRQKNILHRINLFGKNKTGNSTFDSKFVVTGEIKDSDKKFLFQSKLHYQMNSALNTDNVLCISINEYNLDFVPSLKGKSYISVINNQVWNMDRDFIEQTIKQAEAINDIVNQ